MRKGCRGESTGASYRSRLWVWESITGKASKQSVFGRVGDSLQSLTWRNRPHSIAAPRALASVLSKLPDLFSIVGVLVALLLLSQILIGCHLRPLLYNVSVSPEVISPNADGTNDVTSIEYKLSRNAHISIYFEDARGERFYFRHNRPRSARGYRVMWGGTVNQPYWLENEFGRQLVRSWVLPDGTYLWAIEATDKDGQVERVEGQIALNGGDTVIPELHNLTVAPQVITPNQDGLGDCTTVGYCLSKDVDSVQVYLYDSTKPDIRYPLTEEGPEEEVGKVGTHYYDYDGGVERGADPPADGTYIVVAEARDLVGHHVVVSSTLTIKDGGKPRANVVKDTIHWRGAVRSLEGTEMYVPLGATLVFTTYIENYGRVPIRTAGPTSGAHYRSDQDFGALAVEMGDSSYYEQGSIWRFGINFDVSSDDFPYRWAVGQPEELRREIIAGQEQWFLDPGKRGTVIGSIELVGPFPREGIYAWGALIHEGVGISAENNHVDRVLVDIGAP